jgi:hypothetical protein
MNDQANALDQADEDLLTDTASDEALEVAAGTEKAAAGMTKGGLISWSGPSVFAVCC